MSAPEPEPEAAGLGAQAKPSGAEIVIDEEGRVTAVDVLLFNLLSTKVERLMLDLDQAAGQLADQLEVGAAAPEPSAARSGTAELADGGRANGETLATA